MPLPAPGGTWKPLPFLGLEMRYVSPVLAYVATWLLPGVCVHISLSLGGHRSCSLMTSFQLSPDLTRSHPQAPRVKTSTCFGRDTIPLTTEYICMPNNMPCYWVFFLLLFHFILITTLQGGNTPSTGEKTKQTQPGPWARSSHPAQGGPGARLLPVFSVG